MTEDALAKGAIAVTGGRTKKIGNALFLLPTLLANTRPGMTVLNEETFGPLLPVMKVDSDAQAIDLINASKYGLSASIFTRSRARAEQFVEAMQTGTVYVNRCNFVDARLGWTGHKNSGLAPDQGFRTLFLAPKLTVLAHAIRTSGGTHLRGTHRFGFSGHGV